jgi:hypothetical protein
MDKIEIITLKTLMRKYGTIYDALFYKNKRMKNRGRIS